MRYRTTAGIAQENKYGRAVTVRKCRKMWSPSNANDELQIKVSMVTQGDIEPIKFAQGDYGGPSSEEEMLSALAPSSEHHAYFLAGLFALALFMLASIGLKKLLRFQKSQKS